MKLTPKNEVGKKLRKIRKERNLLLCEIGKIFNIKPSTLTRIERGTFTDISITCSGSHERKRKNRSHCRD
ncbi:helix-turn-helix domain-containing protein [Cytobacillus massiliigabonensis]|uniref:helix-turn-helix domain-containing protein n=1 Tax=Cytobacillus massiliigabonensis TaxID=1871011 RepID=UPI001158DD1B|nr:helix-turn-helix domain-containing protein [Cytobacillus massiliigabonensis]